MSESFVECLVKAKKNVKAQALMVLLILLTVASFFFMIAMSGYFLLAAVACGFGAYFAYGYVNVEYEYLYIDKEIVIDRIYNQSKRKRVATYNFEKIQVIAPIKSYHLDNFGKLSDKPKDYSTGVEEQPDKRYVIFYEGREQILFSPNEEMVKVMKNVAPRKVFND